MSDQVSAKSAMYRLIELGDCFLVTFTAGASKSRMLIDCGSFRNTGASVKRLNQITVGDRERARRRASRRRGRHAPAQRSPQRIRALREDVPEDRRRPGLALVARRSDGQGRADDRQGPPQPAAAAPPRARALQLARRSRRQPEAARSLEVLNDMLGFYGASADAAGSTGQRHQDSEKLGAEAAVSEPGRSLDLPGLPAGSVRVHVLGPPRTEPICSERIRGPAKATIPRWPRPVCSRRVPRRRERRDARLAAQRTTTRSTSTTSSADPTALARAQELSKRYRRSRAWRTIDDDWMQQAETLALFLDTFTNNSSLVLAIELVATAARCCCSPPTRRPATGSAGRREVGGPPVTPTISWRAPCSTRSGTTPATTPRSSRRSRR